MHFSCCIHKNNKALCTICSVEMDEEEEEKEKDNNIQNNENNKENKLFLNFNFNIKVNERIKILKLQKIRRLDKEFFEDGFYSEM